MTNQFKLLSWPAAINMAAAISCATWLANFSAAQNNGRSEAGDPKIEFVGPVAEVFSRASVVTFGGVETIYLSGIQGQGDSFTLQTKSALERIEKQLADLGSKKEDIVKLTVYVVNLDAKKSFGDYGRVQKEVLGTTNLPACTMVGVTSLVGAAENKLVEIDATAIVRK